MSMSVYLLFDHLGVSCILLVLIINGNHINCINEDHTVVGKIMVIECLVDEMEKKYSEAYYD